MDRPRVHGGWVPRASARTPSPDRTGRCIRDHGQPVPHRGPQAVTWRRQKMLFDTVAEQYQATRRGYPPEVIDTMVTAAGISAGDAVLEIGCGTGQLPRSLVPFGFDVTAVDIGASMIAVARREVDGPVRWEVVSFEDFDAP